MLKYKKEIHFRRDTIEIVRLRRTATVKHSLFCEVCALETDFLTLDEAINASEQSAREIFRRIERGEIHFYEIVGGSLLICPRSLSVMKND